MLTGDALATEYARTHPLAERNPGKVWATYDGGGWIVLCGSGLKPHPDLAEQFPNGWELFERLRSGEARRRLADNHAKLRETYRAAGV